jgi:hypothetical protein
MAMIVYDTVIDSYDIVLLMGLNSARCTGVPHLPTEI